MNSDTPGRGGAGQRTRSEPLRQPVAAPRAEPIDLLRDDVHLLGELVGDVLREQGGPELFAAVEYVRTAAIALRSRHVSDIAQERNLLQWAQRQPTDRLLQLVRAFSVYFHLINLAEEHHRVRTLRERERAGGPQHESIAAALSMLRGAGVRADTMQASVQALRSAQLAAEDGLEWSGLQDVDVTRWLRGEVYPRESLERLCRLFRCRVPDPRRGRISGA